MSGNPSQTTDTNQSQQSSTQPWTPTQPMLMDMISKLSGTPGGATPGQSTAIQQMIDQARNIPNFGNAASDTLSSLFGLNTQPQQQNLTNAAGALTPFLDKNFMNPATNPYLGPAMSTMNQDITNQIEGQAAAAGRPFGSNASQTQALARGLSQGEGGLLAGEFNTLGGMAQSAAGMMPGINAALTREQ